METAPHPFENAGLGKAPFKFVGMEVRKYQACHGAPIQAGSSCDYCGTGIMYVYHIASSDGKAFKVGSECVRKTDMVLFKVVKAASKQQRKEIAETKRLERKATAASERKAARKTAIDAYAMGNPEVMEALKVSHPVINDIRAQFEQGYPLTSKQGELVIRLAKQASELKCAAPTGKQTFKGTVVSVKSYDSAYGSEWKMTVKVTEERGMWLVWGTVPIALKEANRESNGCFSPDMLKGQEIQISATLKAGNEPHFALMSRPKLA